MSTQNINIMNRKPSIYSIAKEVGVSHVTVSRALNFPEKVKPETLAVIRQAFAKVNFTPSVIPNNLNTLCLLIPDPERLSSTTISYGNLLIIGKILDVLYKYNAHALVTPYSKVETLPEIFRKRFIAFLHGDGHQDYIKTINQLSNESLIAVINDTNDKLSQNIYSVCSDHCQGTELAMNHLLKRGHRKIAFVSGPLASRGSEERFATYRKWMEKESCYNESLTFINNESLLGQGLNRLRHHGATAIFIAQSDFTSKVCHHMHLQGVSIPDELSIITSSFASEEQFYFPQLTKVVQPLDMLAKRVVEVCLAPAPPTALNRGKNAKMERIPYTFQDHESVRFI